LQLLRLTLSLHAHFLSRASDVETFSINDRTSQNTVWEPTSQAFEHRSAAGVQRSVASSPMRALRAVSDSNVAAKNIAFVAAPY
jgi:hypothetical protein